VGKPSKK